VKELLKNSPFRKCIKLLSPFMFISIKGKMFSRVIHFIVVYHTTKRNMKATILPSTPFIEIYY
jgi:hypothetical protein